MSPPDLTFIMCAYNEAGRIEKAYRELLETLKNRPEKVEIMFFDNGSTDGTREWLKTINNPDVKVFFNEANLGKGGSIIKGIVSSSGKYIVIHDPDCEYRAADVWRCYDYAKQTQASMVLGSRVLSKIKVIRPHYLNYIGVRFLTFLINRLYGCNITDAATAIKLFNGEFMRKVYLRCTGFDLDFELITKMARLGKEIREIPIAYEPRTVAEGKKIRLLRDGFFSFKVILADKLAPQQSFLKL